MDFLIISVLLLVSTQAFIVGDRGTNATSAWFTVPKTMPTTIRHVAHVVPTTRVPSITPLPTTNTTTSLQITTKPVTHVVLTSHTPPAAPSSSFCRNTIDTCADYGTPSYACSGLFESWAREHCNKYCGFCAAAQIPTTRAPTTKMCVDKISICSNYGDRNYACSGGFENWARDNCAKYCGFCHGIAMPTTALPMPTTVGVCMDKIQTCKNYGEVSYACHGQYEAWAKLNCARYCGFCHGLPSPTTALPVPTKFTPSVCEDKIPDCNQYGTISYACHGVYENWVMENCAKRCGFCTTHLKPTINSCTTFKADIQFLVDSSPSIGAVAFNKIRAFLHNFTNHFIIGPQHVQIGVTTYSDIIRENIFMKRLQNKTALQQTISTLPFADLGVTHTGIGINFTIHQAFTKEHGDRDGVPNILVTITDGISSKNYTAVIEELKRTQITSFAVGVGNSSRGELEQIALGKERVFSLERISDFLNAPPFNTCQGVVL